MIVPLLPRQQRFSPRFYNFILEICVRETLAFDPNPPKQKKTKESIHNNTPREGENGKLNTGTNKLGFCVAPGTVGTVDADNTRNNSTHRGTSKPGVPDVFLQYQKQAATASGVAATGDTYLNFP